MFCYSYPETFQHPAYLFSNKLGFTHCTLCILAVLFVFIHLLLLDVAKYFHCPLSSIS